MHRRHLLQLAASTAVCSMLPLSVFASAPREVDYGLPIDKIEAVDQAFDLMEDYQFTLGEKAELLGLYAEDYKTLDELRDFALTYIIDWGNRDGWARTKFLLEIRRKLDERFDGNVSAQLEWMKGHEAPFAVQSPRDLMTTGHYMHLYRVMLAIGGKIA